MGALAMLAKKLFPRFMRKVSAGTVLAVLLCITPRAHAFKLVPITMEFEPAGRGASQSFRLENDSDEQIAIQISILSREMDIRGRETNRPASADFIVYPEQILLKPKKAQTVRVKWVGNPKPEKELAYRILAEQLPVNLTSEKSGQNKIRVMVRYLGSIYIVPKGARSDVVVEGAAATMDPAGREALQLTIHNKGAAHTILRDPTLRLTAQGKTTELSARELAGIAGENILAGTKRVFLLRWPEALPKGDVEVTLDFYRPR